MGDFLGPMNNRFIVSLDRSNEGKTFIVEFALNCCTWEIPTIGGWRDREGKMTQIRGQAMGLAAAGFSARRKFRASSAV